MDAAATPQATRTTFRSPPHIIIPKLAKSRDAWKDKAGRRKRELKKAQIRGRDLAASRKRWKERAVAAEQKAHLLQEQLQQAQAQLQQAHAEIAQLQDEQKKTPRSRF